MLRRVIPNPKLQVNLVFDRVRVYRGESLSDQQKNMSQTFETPVTFSFYGEGTDLSRSRKRLQPHLRWFQKAWGAGGW